MTKQTKKPEPKRPNGRAPVLRYDVMADLYDSYFGRIRSKTLCQVTDLQSADTMWAVDYFKQFSSCRHPGERLYAVECVRVELSAYVPMGCGFYDQGWSTQVVWLQEDTLENRRNYLQETECERFMWEGVTHNVW